MSLKKWQKRFLALAVGVLLANPVCAYQGNPDDPYEPFNRVMFKFNDYLDCAILKPVAFVYNRITPKPVAKGLTNFFNNIDMIPTVLNDVLQLNFYQAANDAWRFGINTTIGLAGFIDVASCIGLEPNSEDFGLTLAHWGYVHSNYLILPFLGPGTIRDNIGYSVNYYLLSIYPYIEPPANRYRIFALNVIVRRADMLRYESLLAEISLDKYVFMRDAYLQHRNYLIERNRQLNNPYLSKNRLEDAIDSGPAGVQGGKTEVRTEDATKPFSDI